MSGRGGPGLAQDPGHRQWPEIYRPVELALSSWQAGEDTFYSGIIRDITERQQAEEAIRTLNEALEQRVAELKAANQVLAALSYSIAQDLRAPLRAMNSSSRILLEDYAPQLDAEAQSYLQRVSANALRMGRLIDDLLAFGQLSHKPLRKRLIDPVDLVREVIEDLRPEYAHRQVELVLRDLPACQADPTLLKQVWANLVGNALKFTRGRPVARIEVGSHEQAGERVYFVRDNGVGFEMQYADKLFGVFQRLHSAEACEGTGVGRALTQRIVHRHGGRSWTEAEPDQGATFFFTLGTCERRRSALVGRRRQWPARSTSSLWKILWMMRRCCSAPCGGISWPRAW